MLSKRWIERMAGALLVAAFLAFLGHGLTLKQLGPGKTTIVYVLVYGFLAFVVAVPIYRVFRSHEPTLALFGASGLAAHGLFAVLTCTFLLAGVLHPGEFAGTFGQPNGSMAPPTSAIEQTMDKARTATFVFLNLGILPLGVLIARTGAVARWLGWFGIAAGALGAVSVFAALIGVELPTLGLALLAPLLFSLILGLRLLAREVGEGGLGR